MGTSFRGALGGVLSAFVVSGLFALASWQCIKIPTEPVLPNWDTPLSIPLVDTTYYLRDALQGNTDVIPTDSVYVYNPARYDFQPVSLGGQLQLRPPRQDTTATVKVGLLNLTAPDPISEEVRLSKIIQPISVHLPWDGDTTIAFSDSNPTTVPRICGSFLGLDTCVLSTFPAQSFGDTLSFTADTSQFDYVQLVSGGLELAIQNNLPIPVQITTLQLFNSSDNSVVQAFPPITIPAGSAVVDSADLSGRKISSSLSVILQLATDTAGLPLTFNPGSGISVGLEFTGPFVVSEARFKLPAVPLVRDTTYKQVLVDDSTYIDTARFRSGRISVTVKNDVAAEDSVFFKFIEFVDQNGQPLVINSVVHAHDSLVVPIDLSQYSLVSSTTSNHVDYEVWIQTLTGTGLQTIYSTDSVSVHVHLDPVLQLQTVVGRMKPFKLALNETVNLPEIHLGSNFSADSVTLSQDTLLRVYIQTAAGHPIDFHLLLQGLRKDNSIAGSIRVQPDNPAGDAWRFLPGVVNVIPLTGIQLTSFLTNFPYGQPNRLVISDIDSAVVNPYDVYGGSHGSAYPGYIGRVDDTTRLFTWAEFNVPLKVKIYNGGFLDTVDIRQTSTTGTKVDSNIIKHVLGGNFTFIIQNKIPVNLRLLTTFKTGAGDSLQKFVQVGRADTIQTVQLSINSTEARIFNRSTIAIVRLLLDTGDQVAAFEPTQYVRVRAFSNLRFNINPDELTRGK